MMDTQLIQFVVVALAAVFVFFLLMRRRATKLKLRIEPVSEDRLDNTPIERNEIVSEVRVRAREQAVAKSASLTAELTRIEPTVDSSSDNQQHPVAPETLASTGAESASIERLAGQEVAAGRVHDATPEAREPAIIIENTAPHVPVLTQEDLFPEAQSPESSLSGLDNSDLAFERVISIHVMARDEGIPGRVLLEHLLQYGLRYGDMAIFHRHEHPTGQGAILFSLAQAMEPGTFDIDTLARDSVPGVSLFLGLPGYKCLVAYDLMIDTARRLANALHADMLDDNGQALTAAKLADWRDAVVSADARATTP